MYTEKRNLNKEPEFNPVPTTDEEVKEYFNKVLSSISSVAAYGLYSIKREQDKKSVGDALGETIKDIINIWTKDK